MSVGFQGGSSIIELGTASDMVCFFSVMREKVVLSRDELDIAIAVMLRFKQCLSIFSVNTIELKSLGWNSEGTSLDVGCNNLAVLFDGFFSGFEFCVESTRGFYEDWSVYKPVRIVVCDMPGYLVGKLIALSDYDELRADDLPLWLR